MRACLSSILAGLVLSVCSLSVCDAAGGIEAVRGKSYKLTQQHGPWMIMVATFRDLRGEDGSQKEGMIAREAAETLVLELRELGIPAYIHEQGAVIEKMQVRDRLGRAEERVFAAQRDMLSVLAGNYPDIEDKTAQKTLAYVKKYYPKFMKDGKSGAVHKPLDGKSGPLFQAFLTINPLVDPNQVVSKLDREVLAKNQDLSFPLVNVKQKYSLKVATFTGRSATPFGNSSFKGNESKFDKLIKDQDKPTGVNRAGEDAVQLTHALRTRKIEAYTYHDRYQSIVTVGAFDDPNDPGIRRLFEAFCAKEQFSGPSGQKSMMAEMVADNGEFLSQIIQVGGPKRDLPPVMWICDPVPKLVDVPRFKK